MENTINITATKRITMATVKSFVKNNRERLFVKKEMAFNSMSDMVEAVEGGQEFRPAVFTDRNMENRLGMENVWFVLGGNDYLKYFENDQFIGVEVYNSCGSFTVAVVKPGK